MVLLCNLQNRLWFSAQEGTSLVQGVRKVLYSGSIGKGTGGLEESDTGGQEDTLQGGHEGTVQGTLLGAVVFDTEAVSFSALSG